MKSFKEELIVNILPFWISNMKDLENGGFYGKIDGEGLLHPRANKGAILNARILWTFSAAYRLFKDEEYLIIANRAFEYIIDFFIDNEYGGVYWELDYKGNPVNTKKQTYAQSFALYGFSEFYRATGNVDALEISKQFYEIIQKSYDKKLGGYWEAFSRNWEPIDDMRLSDKDVNENKTMNTHLHVLESYTNLLRIWKDDKLIDSQRMLVGVFVDKILKKDPYHLGLFFDDYWNVKSSVISYGHDIEASWLLLEAADILGDDDLFKTVKSLSLHIANDTLKGLNKDGSLSYEKSVDYVDSERHWWVQAEAVVGYMYAYKSSGNVLYKEVAIKLWNYILKYIVDKDNGEWHWSRLSDGSINVIEDKAGFWKCPYHNSRMCMEMIEHLNFFD